jgi:hypothetical protein
MTLKLTLLIFNVHFCLQFCEVSGHFRPHSFRIGGATEAKRRGVDDDVIKQWGHWSSSAHFRYIE